MICKNFISVSNLFFSYREPELLLNGVSFQLSARNRVVLCGPNGCGKTSLLKILIQQLCPDCGSVEVQGTIAWVLQEASSTHSNLSGGESRFAGLKEAFEKNTDFLFLDEPTNDLDAKSKNKLFEYFKNYSGGLFLISHDPEVLDFVDEIWELKNGQIQKHPPGFKAFMERINHEEENLRAQIRSFESEQKKQTLKSRQSIERQEKRAARGESHAYKTNLPKIYRGTLKRQAEKTLAKVQGVHEKISERQNEKIAVTKKRLRQLSLFKWNSQEARPPNGKRLLELENVKLKNFKKALSFQMLGAQRVHLTGQNGSGKSTLLKALAGQYCIENPASGKFYLASPFCFFDQKLSQFMSDEKLWVWFAQKTQKPIFEARQILGGLGFEQEEQERPVHGLSGGEKIRLELSIAVNQHAPPQILLLDEPSNHLDFESRRILVEFLKDFQGAILLVSHDQDLINALEIEKCISLDEFI